MEVPEEVLDVVARTKPELEEVDWEKVWNFFSREGWQNPPRGPMYAVAWIEGWPSSPKVSPLVA